MPRKGKNRRHWERGRSVKGVRDVKHLQKLGVKRDDLVEIISGADKGQRGKILRTIPSEGKVVVQGVNRRWKHLRRSQQNPQGGRIEREVPIPIGKIRKVEG